MADVIVRAAHESDADAIGALWSELVAYHHALDAGLPQAAPNGPDHYAQALHDHLNSPVTRVLVAEADGCVVGYVLGVAADMVSSLFMHETAGFIADLYVRPDFQRQGVGRQLVLAIHDWFTRQGVKQAEWYVAVKNESAQAFWRALGGAPLLMRMRSQWPEEQP